MSPSWKVIIFTCCCCTPSRAVNPSLRQPTPFDNTNSSELPVSTALHRYGRPLAHTQPGYVRAGGTLSEGTLFRLSEITKVPYKETGLYYHHIAA